jgi:predicted peptidase
METTLQNYSADRSRLYVTGNSLGGFATYELAAAHPHLFAAALPISGGGDIALAEKLKSIPIWAAHGLWDQDVKLKFDWNLYQAIKKTGNQQMHFSLHLLKMHNVWDVTYKNKKIVRWLLEQKLSI